MSPLDMLIFLFFILVAIKAALTSIDYWRDIDDELAEEAEAKRLAAAAAHSRTVRTATPSSVRVTPIKRDRMPAAAVKQHCHTKDKGVA